MAAEQVFVSTAAKSIIDQVKDGVGVYGRETLEKVRERYPDVQIMSDEEAIKAIEAAYCAAPIKRIDRERFKDMLEVLPPCRWTHGADSESFHVPEPIFGGVVSIFVRVGEQYFEMMGMASSFPDARVGPCRQLVQEDKRLAADAVLSEYDFGDGVWVVGSDGWDTSDPLDFVKTVYARYDDDPDGADSHKLSFHVRFAADGSTAVDEGYALSVESGGEIGRRGDLPKVVTEKVS